MLALLKRDCSQDNESASSAELSNADSGRGPSEEGDHHNHSCTPSKHSECLLSLDSLGIPDKDDTKISSFRSTTISEHVCLSVIAGIRGDTPQSLSSPRQPTHVISPARGHPVQPRGGSARLQRPPPPPQRRLYPGTASPPSYGDFVRNTRANSSARTAAANDSPLPSNANHGNSNNNSHSNASPPPIPTKGINTHNNVNSPGSHSNQSKNSSSHGNKDNDSCSPGSQDSQDNVDPDQLQAEINELFFKGVIV